MHTGVALGLGDVDDVSRLDAVPDADDEDVAVWLGDSEPVWLLDAVLENDGDADPLALGATDDDALIPRDIAGELLGVRERVPVSVCDGGASRTYTSTAPGRVPSHM
jgi:hypothetical protein